MDANPWQQCLGLLRRYHLHVPERGFSVVFPSGAPSHSVSASADIQYLTVSFIATPCENVGCVRLPRACPADRGKSYGPGKISAMGSITALDTYR